MIDILFLTYHRLEFARASMAALLANTDWSLVRRLIIYDDSVMKLGGPVAVMNHYLQSGDTTPIFAKIDSDTMVPDGWLNECVAVMDKHPELDLLGIEAFRPVVAGKAERTYDSAQYIGGIGLMRSAAFKTLPQPNGPSGRFGFTAWQEHNPKVKKGWLNPALPVFLLDKLPMEPWAGYSREYVKNGWQRVWPPYTEEDAHLWGWWTP